jgi:hypothetical protein
MRLLTNRGARIGALVVVVLGLAAGGVAYASIPESSGVIHGCYQKINGQLRVIDANAGGACSSSESPLAWNQFSSYEIVSSDFNESSGPAFRGFIENQSCPAGKSVLGGGASARFIDAAGNRLPAQLGESLPSARDTWSVTLWRSDGAILDAGDGVRGTVYAICAYTS